jgi:hypothetical protein
MSMPVHNIEVETSPVLLSLAEHILHVLSIQEVFAVIMDFFASGAPVFKENVPKQSSVTDDDNEVGTWPVSDEGYTVLSSPHVHNC